jgi:L,D-transpeptidase-like protein
MPTHKYLLNSLIGVSATIYVGAQVTPDSKLSRPAFAPQATAAVTTANTADTLATSAAPTNRILAKATDALAAFGGIVRPLSHPKALESAFRGYFAFLSTHPNEVKKPYLYFVDYGLPSTEPRGYVFDMKTLKVVDGPFTVAHGRGSSTSQYGVPTRFSNTSGASTTALGLYLAQSTYAFSGHAAGRAYNSIGLRLQGLSGAFNDRALARGVVAHGAPYVTSSKAGRSQGCPALEESRARTLLPKIADGGMVFLFAPDADWMAKDPWIVASE